MKVLQSISALLSRQTPVFISLVAVFAFFVPGVFSWVHGTSQTAVLGTIMLTMGMTLTGEDFRILASRPLDLAIGAVAQYTLMPLIAFALVHLLGLPRGIAAGLLLVGCCPGGVSSNIMSFLCKGDVAFSVGMTSLSTLCAPVVTPLLMLVLAVHSADGSVAVNPVATYVFKMADKLYLIGDSDSQEAFRKRYGMDDDLGSQLMAAHWGEADGAQKPKDQKPKEAAPQAERAQG